MSLRNAVRNVARRGRSLSGDSTAPTVTSVTVAANGLTVTVVFAETVTGADPDGVITLNVPDQVSCNYASGNLTNTVVFTASSEIFAGQTVTADYLPGNIRDLAGNPLAEFSGMSVTNNSTVWWPLNQSGLTFLADWYSLKYTNNPPTTLVSANDDPVFWWYDRSGNARHIRALDNASRAIYKSAGGPSGQAAVNWDGTNAQGLYVADGSFLLTAAGTLAVVGTVPAATGATNELWGIGGFGGNGWRLFCNTAGTAQGQITTGGSATTVNSAVNVGSAGTPFVLVMSYDGTTCRIRCTGNTTQSAAKSGTIESAVDTAACAGAVTGDGSSFAFKGAKTLALVMSTNVGLDADGVNTLFDNLTTYAGVS